MKRRRRLRPKEPQIEFRTWSRRRARLPLKAPPGSTVRSADGLSLITTTPMGTALGWSHCGLCGVHVASCACTSPRAPRSVAYIWFQDEARMKGEEWSHEHPNYRRAFDAPETPTRRSP